MVELIVNDYQKFGNLKQWIVISHEQVIKNYRAIFGDKGVKGLTNAMILLGNSPFYDIKRCFQFVGIVKYAPLTQMYTMSLFESDSMDNFLDAFGEMAGRNWKKEDLTKIGDIMQEIIDDKNKKSATVKLKKTPLVPHVAPRSSSNESKKIQPKEFIFLYNPNGRGLINGI